MTPSECPRTIPYVILWYCHTAMILISFTKYLHRFGLIIYKSGYATETLVKELGGYGGVLHFKGIHLYSATIRLKSK